jgi:phage-related protein (TIGR01555 family)
MARTNKAAGAQMRRASEDPKFATHRTHDSFQNFLARVGIGTDNVSSGGSYGFNPTSRNRTQLEWMYRGSWMVGQVVDCVAEDMTREGVSFLGELEPDTNDALHGAARRWQIWQHLNDTIKWARLYGGAIAVILIDGQDPKTPLRLETVGSKQFRGLLVLDRWMVQPSLTDLVTELGPDLGLPKYYDTVADAPALARMRVHHSRCLRIDGVELPYWQKISENLWGMSVVERLFDRLLAFDSATQGAAQLVYKAHLRTMKVKNLREIIAAGGPVYQAFLKQIDMIRAYQASEGMTLLDADDEFETHQYTFAGLDDMLAQFGQQLSGASQIPLVRLFGQAPKGLNATGESDLRNYYDGILQKQERYLRRPVETVFNVLMRSEGIERPKNFGVEFIPLWQLTEKEKAEVAKSTTETVSTAFGSALISEQTALKELRQSSRITGIWTNITDEDINNAESEPPDPSEMAPEGQEEAEEGQSGPGGVSKDPPKPKADDEASE